MGPFGLRAGAAASVDCPSAAGWPRARNPRAFGISGCLFTVGTETVSANNGVPLGYCALHGEQQAVGSVWLDRCAAAVPAATGWS